MLENNKKYHDLLVKLVGLRYPGVAFKLIKDESEVPEGAVRPMKDWGYHIAVCQAFAYARRQGKTIYMEKEDHWCWNPIIVYGMIDNETAKKGFRAMHKQLGTSMESADKFVDSFPCIPYGEYRGVLVAPLDKAISKIGPVEYRKTYLADGVHPNPEGHKLFAEVLLKNFVK